MQAVWVPGIFGVEPARLRLFAGDLRPDCRFSRHDLGAAARLPPTPAGARHHRRSDCPPHYGGRAQAPLEAAVAV